MKNRNLLINKLNLQEINIDDLDAMLEPWELGVLLRNESECRDVDIMLENMLEYYLMYEQYEYCCIIRDEINRRLKKVSNNTKKIL